MTSAPSAPAATTPDDPSAAIEASADAREGLPTGVSGAAATERMADSRPVLAWIMGAIAGWGIVLAAGVVLYDYRAGAVNLGKPLTIVLCVAAFLGLFRWTMARGSRRPPSPVAE
jgi:hypothetical protein